MITLFIVTQFDASLCVILRKPQEVTLQITYVLLDRLKECYRISESKDKHKDPAKDLSPPSEGTGNASTSAVSQRPLRTVTSLQRALQEAAKRDEAEKEE